MAFISIELPVARKIIEIGARDMEAGRPGDANENGRLVVYLKDNKAYDWLVREYYWYGYYTAKQNNVVSIKRREYEKLGRSFEYAYALGQLANLLGFSDEPKFDEYLYEYSKHQTVAIYTLLMDWWLSGYYSVKEKNEAKRGVLHGRLVRKLMELTL